MAKIITGFHSIEEKVRAGKNQIYTYDNKKSGMVKQYADIPGVDE